MQIHQLPPITDIPAASMLAVDNGSANNCIAAEELLKPQSIIILPITQDITASVDALTVGRAYTIRCYAYGAQGTCGVPANENYFGYAECVTANVKSIILIGVTTGNVWIKKYASSAWTDWRLVSGTLTGTITRGTMMHASDTIKVSQSGGMATLQIACRIITAGSYGASDVLATSTIKPASTYSALMALGSGTAVVRITTTGEIAFNSTQTVAANNYLIGQISFPVA